MAGLTKQHFKEFAKLINKYWNSPLTIPTNTRDDFIQDLSIYFKTQNPLFNENQFKKACLK